MRLLLDTHTVLWLIHDSKKLPEATKKAVLNADETTISIASLWEVAIKKSIGKLDIAESVSDIEAKCFENNLAVLPISVAALEEIQKLPDVHGDPFDRLLIATALADDMILVTNDRVIERYDVQTLWNEETID